MKFSAKLTAWLFAAACIGMLSCEEDDATTKTLQVHINHFLQPIKGTASFPVTEGYWVQDTIDLETWWLRSAPIQGFDFEWGYTYDLIVEVNADTAAMQDDFFPVWTLKRIVNKTKVPADATFELHFSTSESIQNIAVDEALNFTTSNGMTVNCGSLCETFAQRLAEQAEATPNFPLTGFFKHVNNTTVELVAVE